MAKTILYFAIAFLAVITVFASAAEAGSKRETDNQNSTISTAALDSDETVETAAEPKDEPEITKNVGCKKFFPAVGMALTVPCDVETPAPAVEAETPTPVIKKESPSITKETPSSKKKSTSRRKSSRSTKKYRKRRASVGSCGGCRNSCYVRYRVRSHSRQFVPCMRRCWHQACR
jgi:hypothetical protein